MQIYGNNFNGGDILLIILIFILLNRLGSKASVSNVLDAY